MQKPARSQVRDIKGEGQSADPEDIARDMIEIDQHASDATAKETQAPKRKCPSSERSAKKASSGLAIISSAFP